jgi:hypothetical protein
MRSTGWRRSERGGTFVDLHRAGVPSDTVRTLFVADDETGDAMARAYGSPLVYGHRLGGGEGIDPGLLNGRCSCGSRRRASPRS